MEERKFYVAVGKRTIGPVSAEQVIDAIRKGKIAPDADACIVGGADWTPIGEMRQFAREFGSPVAIPPAAAPSTKDTDRRDPTGATEAKFYARVNGKIIGPARNQIIDAIKAGQISNDVEVCAVGASEWRRIRDVEPFASAFATTPGSGNASPGEPTRTSSGTVVEAAPGGFDYMPTTVIDGPVGAPSSTASPKAPASSGSAHAPIQISQPMLIAAVLGIGGLCFLCFVTGAWISRPSAPNVPPPSPATTATASDPSTAAPAPSVALAAPVAAPTPTAADLIVGAWQGSSDVEVYEADGTLRIGTDTPVTYSISGTAESGTLIVHSSIGDSSWITSFPDTNTMIQNGHLLYHRLPAGALAAPSASPGSVRSWIVGEWRASARINEAFRADGSYLGVVNGAVLVGRYTISGTLGNATLTTYVTGAAPHPWPVTFVDRNHFQIGLLHYVRTADQ